MLTIFAHPDAFTRKEFIHLLFSDAVQDDAEEKLKEFLMRENDIPSVASFTKEPAGYDMDRWRWEWIEIRVNQ